MRRLRLFDHLIAPIHLWLLVAVVVAAVAVQLVGSGAAELLRYDREAILDGQLWRLLSGHLVHLGWAHLALNLAGLLLLVLGFAGRISGSLWRALLCIAVLMLGVSVGLLLGSPELEWYVGLSGALHGLGTLIAVGLWRRGERTGLVLLAGLILKVGWDQLYGTGSVTGVDIGGAVIVDAHLYGMISAGIILLVGYVFNRFNAARRPG